MINWAAKRRLSRRIDSSRQPGHDPIPRMFNPPDAAVFAVDAVGVKICGGGTLRGGSYGVVVGPEGEATIEDLRFEGQSIAAIDNAGVTRLRNLDIE